MESATFYFLLVILVILGVIAIKGFRSILLLKMGLRNITRRKVNTFIVVMGLMIGTSIISGSLVVGDTLQNMFTKGVYDTYDETDEEIYTFDQSGSFAFVDDRAYYDIQNFTQQDPVLSSKVEGLSPEIRVPVAVFNLDTRLTETEVTLNGFDYGESQAFGGFQYKKGGKTTGEDLLPGHALVNELLAEEIDIQDGHRLQLYFGDNQSTVLTVKVVKDEGRAFFGWGFGAGSGMNILLPLDQVQILLGQEGRINFIKVSNVGGVKSGMDESDAVEERLTPFLYQYAQDPENPALFLVTAKQDGVENAVEGSKSLQQLFMVMGIFTIIAGIILVVNIFVMLAEERKSEMGMARAVGMKQRHLMEMFLFEGTGYSVLAAFVGTLAGLGVAAAIIYGFSVIFIADSGFNPMEFFTFTIDSLVIAFGTGLLITLFTIWYSSWKVSKLNIIRAIRNIPEPRYQQHEIREIDPKLPPLRQLRIRVEDLVLFNYEYLIIFGGLFLVFAAFVNVVGPLHHMAWAGYGGFSVALYGIALLLRRYVEDRWAFTFGGASVLIYWGLPFDYYEIFFGIEMYGGMEMFVISGLFMVTSALMVVMYNDRLLLNALVKIFGRSKTLAPIFKTAVSYPMDNRGRTARVLAIFSLIIFTITVLAMIMGLINGNIDQITKEQSGSYDMMVTSNNPHTPLTGLEFEIEESENLSSGDFDVIVPLYTSMSLVYGIDGELPEAERGEIIEANLSRPLSEFQDDASWYDLVGCPAVFFQESDYELSEWDEDAYGDGDDDYKKVWDAVRDNDSLAIVDGTVVPEEFGPREEGLTLKLGDYILVRDTQNHSKVVKVVGITKQRLVRGVFVVQSVVTVEMEAETSSVALLKFDEDVSKKEQVEIAKDMESELVVYGMRTFIIEQELKDMLRSMTNFFYLLQAFLGLGLLVGIAGLGIITIRVVTERRQQIGMLRALGFKQSMIKLSFLIETSFIALLGIFIGVALGIILGVRMWMQDFQDGNVAFVIPWGTIIIISLISYVFTFLCTYAPASAAAKIPPAEALRYIG